MLDKPRRSVMMTSLWRAAALAALALTASVALVSNAAAQEEGLTLYLTGLSADTPSEARAVVTVLGSEGLPVPNLAVGDVQAQINNVFVPVVALDRGVDSSLPIAVVLALDVSGSMEGGALDEAKAAARRFLEDLGPEDSVAVLTFNDTVNVAVPFTQDHEAAAAVIAGLNAEGATALYQATAESVRLAASTEHPYRAVILLSDGLDHGSVLSRDEAVATVEALAAPVFVIGLGDEIDEAYLEEVASQWWPLRRDAFACRPGAVIPGGRRAAARPVHSNSGHVPAFDESIGAGEPARVRFVGGPAGERRARPLRATALHCGATDGDRCRGRGGRYVHR